MARRSGTGAKSGKVDISIYKAERKSTLRHKTEQKWQHTPDNPTNIGGKEREKKLKKKTRKRNKRGIKGEEGKGRQKGGGIMKDSKTKEPGDTDLK